MDFLSQCYICTLMRYNIIFVVLCTAVYTQGTPTLEDARHKVMSQDLVQANEIKLVDPTYIHLAMIITNVNVGNLVEGILEVFKNILTSIFLSSEGTPLHVILITDEQSKDFVQEAIYNSIGKYLSETVIRWIHNRRVQRRALVFPQLYFEFVNIQSIVQPNRAAIDEMKKYYCLNLKEATPVPYNKTFVAVISPKYSQDLFFIGPYYPTAFTQLNRLVLFDVDLDVREDLGVLHSNFDRMRDDEIIGIALDQNGYYKGIANKLIQDGLLNLDNVLLHRGLNTGVVLYNLEKMRSSELYQEQAKPENYGPLSHSYGLVQQVVGDQEWFNLLLWTHPQLYKILPCEYNLQKSVLSFADYKCTAPPKILHLHGKIHDKKGENHNSKY